jgi:rhamnosyltransferase
MSGGGVSVLLPTRNGAATLPALLDGLRRQRFEGGFETVAIDSGSTDGTLGLLDGRVDRVLQVPPSSFDHGETRNEGIRACRGDLVVLLVQDAQPASEDWLSALTAPLFADPGLAGTFARQQPREDASAVVRHYLSSWAGASAQPRVLALAGPRELEALPPMERVLRCSFDNVCSCIRREAWQRHPFPRTEIAEDVAWAREVLLDGGRLAYVPEAVVVHSHDRPARYELQRTYLVHRRLRLLFGLQTIPTLRHLVRAVAVSVLLHARLERGAVYSRPRRFLRSLALAFAFPLGQYLGARAADSGRPLLRTSGI